MRVTKEHVAAFVAAFDRAAPGLNARVIAGLTAVDELFTELQPQRDYRKEMWIAAWNDYSGAPVQKTGWADEALNEFDKRFPS